ncbi:MAG: alkaline phosphatase family protein [Rhodomicrobium sp.]
MLKETISFHYRKKSTSITDERPRLKLRLNRAAERRCKKKSGKCQENSLRTVIEPAQALAALLELSTRFFLLRLEGLNMRFAKFLRCTTALLTTVALLLNSTVSMAQPQLTLAQKIALLRSKVKYLFVIFHENESFDHYFGTFPGANGLLSAPAGTTPANQTASFKQTYLDTNLNVTTISPFLMPQAVQAGGYNSGGTIVPIYPADMISVNHGHQDMANSMHVVNGVALNDRYAMDEESLTTDASGHIVTKSDVAATSMPLASKQKAEADISHIDCDTIPFMWSWAKNFVLFDNFRQTIVGPSTPNAIALIAGQSGQTQWALHPNEGAAIAYAATPLGNSYGSTITPADSNAYVPVVADPGPFPGSNLDTSKVKPPYNAGENPAIPSLNLTFASQPLSFMGRNILKIVATDPNPAADLLDVQHDIQTIAALDPAVNWGWYQQGFNANDSSTVTSYNTSLAGANAGYVLHHNGPQYFAYLAGNPQVLNTNLHGAKDFLTAVNNKALPGGGGVFYLRGGYNNNDGLVPVDPTPAIQKSFIGNDDHPSYSDQQISEAFAAGAINAIAASPYWSQSAIIITYDETEGFYDHVSPEVRSTLADGTLLSAGPRIPTILISPYAAAGTISHQYSEHSSVIKFINELFGLVPLASLPDEVHARALGQTNLGQANLEPSDDPNNGVGDLTEAFDYNILQGTKSPIPASQATFSQTQVMSLPHLARASYNTSNGYTNGACQAVGVLPTDFPSWAAYKAGNPVDPYPVDVNPRPSSSQSPGTPTSGNWTP